MKRFTCVAVDDNPDALQIIVRLINKSEDLILLHADTDPHNAYRLIAEKKINPDIMFLNIQMPGFWGLDFADKINGPLVIYTTAYRDFWSDALDKDSTVHYLLKPVFQAKFNKAVSKAISILEQNIVQENVLKRPDFLSVPGNGKQKRIRIPTENILYCNASSNYTDIYLENGKVITTFLTLKIVETLLLRPWFARIQRSYFVNVAKVTHFDANNIFIGEKIRLPIGPSYKEGLTGLFN